MKYKENPELNQHYLDQIASNFTEDRGKDVHVSDLTRCITRTYWGRTEANKLDAETSLYFLTGVGFEGYLTRSLDTNSEEPVPGLDGIIGTPDDERLSDDENDEGMYSIIGYTEIKSTRMSIKNGEPSKGFPPEWIIRMMAYAHMHGVVEWDLTILYIIAAKLSTHTFTWEPEELEHFWNNYILPRRDALVQAMDTGISPHPFEYNNDWECGKCPFNMNCQIDIMADNFHPRVVETDKEWLLREIGEAVE